MSMYVKHFESWRSCLNLLSFDTEADGLSDIIEGIKKIENHVPYAFFIQDYTNFNVRYASSRSFEICGHYPEHFYSEGIELGLRLHHSDYLHEILKFQRKVFETVQDIPKESKRTLKVSYCAMLYNRAMKDYLPIQSNITPLVFDESGNIVLDLVSWQSTKLYDLTNGFIWSISYRNYHGQLIEHSNINTISQLEDPLLSKAENRILSLLIKGKTSKYIADRLSLSKHTVNTHRRNILKKKGLNSTHELISLYRLAK